MNTIKKKIRSIQIALLSGNSNIATKQLAVLDSQNDSDFLSQARNLIWKLDRMFLPKPSFEKQTYIQVCLLLDDFLEEWNSFVFPEYESEISCDCEICTETW
jgi:hypothetical protein